MGWKSTPKSPALLAVQLDVGEARSQVFLYWFSGTRMVSELMFVLGSSPN